MLDVNSQDTPILRAGCTYERGGFAFAFGGYGTFFNKAALKRMTRPIYCDGRQDQEDGEHVDSICSNLRQNRVGELALFQDGDSVFDVFYKFSATQNFCMHSDWAIGYMIQYYSGGSLKLVAPRRQCKGCNNDSSVCHNQTPKDMEDFVSAHFKAAETVVIEQSIS